MQAFVALGSNLGTPYERLCSVLSRLKQSSEMVCQAVSPFYVTEPFGGVPQPAYLNGVVLLRTDVPPLELLDFLQGLEKAEGRTRTVRWGPRSLDLDLLLYGEECIDHERLTVSSSRHARAGFCPKTSLRYSSYGTLCRALVFW